MNWRSIDEAITKWGGCARTSRDGLEEINMDSVAPVYPSVSLDVVGNPKSIYLFTRGKVNLDSHTRAIGLMAELLELGLPMAE